MSHVLNRSEIKEIIPHRDPFLFVDEIVEIVPGKRIVGQYQPAQSGKLRLNDQTGIPCFPSALLIEAMAQVGAVLVLYPPERRGQTIFFRAIEKACFHRTVPAGSTIRVEGEVLRMRSRLGSFKLKAFLGKELAAEGIMSFALTE